MNHQRADTDPFASEFSQARAETTVQWPVLQWHGGYAALADDTHLTMRTHGGFFIAEESLGLLDVDVTRPPDGFDRVTLKLGGKEVPGWGASLLRLAFLFSDFSWEDRATGRLHFPPEEYERRKQYAPGTERELRGRTRALVAVWELMDPASEPLLLSVRGTYSAALNAILREAGRMATEATRLRHAAGEEGAVPREAFWVPIYAGELQEVGSGQNTSRVALPKPHVPDEWSRDLLVRFLVGPEYRGTGGLWDRWANQYGAAWEAARRGEAAVTGDDQEVEREPELRDGQQRLSEDERVVLYEMARQVWPGAAEARGELKLLNAIFWRHCGCDLDEATPQQAERMISALRQRLHAATIPS